MDATFAGRSSPRRAARPGIVFIVETLAVFVALSAPYFALDYASGTAVGAGLAMGYLLWPFLAHWRKRRKAKESASRPEKAPARVTLLVAGFLIAPVLAACSVSAAIALGWVTRAYRTEIVPADVGPAMWAAIAALVLAPALFLALARPRGKGTPANDFLHTVRARGLAGFREGWLQEAAFTLALICYLGVVAGIIPLASIMESMNTGVEPAPWDLALAFPFIPLGLAAVAAMLSIHRMIGLDRTAVGAIARAYADGSATSPAPAGRTGVFGGFAVAGAWVATLYAFLYPTHLGLVAALSSVAGIGPAVATTEAVDSWVEKQRAEGRKGAEMAAVLNEYGRWSEDAPESGLPELFPDLKDSLSTGDTSGLASCSIALAAGAADPAAVSGIDWLEPEYAASDLRYCLRTACPSPVVWEAPDTVLLSSSHPSRNEHWAGVIFIDVFARGRATAAGGYCNADGTLADNFQG